MSAELAPWLCRHGRHRWAFVSMSNRRTIDIIGHTAHLCRLVEKCHRCGLTRTTPSAPVPKRVKVRDRQANDGTAS